MTLFIILTEDRVFCAKLPDPLSQGVGSGHKTSCAMALQWVAMAFHPRVNDVLPRASPSEEHH